MKRVLIVDDAMLMRYTLKSILTKADFDIVGEAENGYIGFNKCKELKPDIVTMDITMPEMDGITAIKKIREIDKNCKIIVISAMGQEGFVREAIISGANSFIVKPFHEEKILQTISKL